MGPPHSEEQWRGAGGEEATAFNDLATCELLMVQWEASHLCPCEYLAKPVGHKAETKHKDIKVG